MSKWMDFSANMLKQTYLKGFLDISGQGIYLRNDSSINFYDIGNSTMSTSLETFNSGLYFVRITDLKSNQIIYKNRIIKE